MPYVNLPWLIKKLHISLQRVSNHQVKSPTPAETASLCRGFFFLTWHKWPCRLWLTVSELQKNVIYSIGFKINSHCREKSRMRAAITARCHRAHYWAHCCSKPRRKNTKQLWPFLISGFLFSFVLSHGNFIEIVTRSGEANRIYENIVITQMSGPCQPLVASGDTEP